jgi:geranyl-CoA carboxylase alpha subunit
MEIHGGIPQLTSLTIGDATIDITSNGQSYTVSTNGQTQHVELLESADGRLDLAIDGRHVRAYVSSEGQTRWVTVGGRTFRLTRKMLSVRSRGGHDGSSDLAAPMPGQVRAVNIQAGEPVTKGQVLVVLEAMKMEIRLQAPFDGQVLSVDASVGQTVEREQILVKLQRPHHSEA